MQPAARGNSGPGESTNAPGFEFWPSPLLRDTGDEPRQVCRLTIADQPNHAEADLQVRRNGSSFSFPLKVLAGTSQHELLLPEVTEPCQASVELTIGERVYTTEVSFSPVRRWQVFVVSHSHTDIGFTHKVSDVVAVHNKNIELALEFGAATASWPHEARYRWTCESAWQVQNYLRAHPGDRQRLAAAIHEGTIEVEALYIHSYFDLLSREQLTRSLSYAQRLRRELAVPITSAMICDVPGCTWSLVDLLAASDVRYLSMAPNNFLAPFIKNTDLPRPFIWEGPARGRVLVWYTDDPFWAYIEGKQYGFWDGVEVVNQKLPAKLAQLEADAYPFDAVQIQIGSDNRPLRFLPATIVREWNRTYVSPRLRTATPSTFFHHAETNWGDQLLVVSGEWQSSWSQTTLSYPQEANKSRRNHNSLDGWERLAVIADWLNEAYTYPRAELAAAYDASLLFDEHSGPKGIWRPRNEQEAREALVEGYALFEQQTLPTQRGLAAALASATGALAGGEDPSVVVWNLLGRPQSGVVDVSIPAAWLDTARTLIDETSGRAAPFEAGDLIDDEVRCRLACDEVPAIGYKRYRLTSKENQPRRHTMQSPTAHVNGDEAVLENELLAITVDMSGAITRLIDSSTGVDFVDRSDWPGLNTLVRYRSAPHGPEPGGSFIDQTELYVGTPVEGHTLESRATQTQELQAEQVLGRASVRANAVFNGLYRRQVEICLHGDWIEVSNRLYWLRRPTEREVLYVLFPFALPAPHIRHASQFAIVDPRTQTLSGSSLDAFAIQNWLDLSLDNHGVTLHSTDLALADYGGINFQRFLRQLDADQGWVAFRAASGQALPSNEVTPFGQDEFLEIRYAIRPYAGAFDPVAAHRFGEEQALPLRATTLPCGHPGEWMVDSASFIDLRSSSVMLTGLKRAEFDDGYVIRLWESAGRQAYARLSFPQHELLSAWQLTPAEGNLGPYEIIDGGLRCELGPFQSATFRCILAK